MYLKNNYKELSSRICDYLLSKHVTREEAEHKLENHLYSIIKESYQNGEIEGTENTKQQIREKLGL